MWSRRCLSHRNAAPAHLLGVAPFTLQVRADDGWSSVRYQGPPGPDGKPPPPSQLLAIRNIHAKQQAADGAPGPAGAAPPILLARAMSRSRPPSKRPGPPAAPWPEAKRRRGGGDGTPSTDVQTPPPPALSALDVGACAEKLIEALMESFEEQQQGTRLNRDEWEARLHSSFPVHARVRSALEQKRLGPEGYRLPVLCASQRVWSCSSAAANRRCRALCSRPVSRSSKRFCGG